MRTLAGVGPPQMPVGASLALTLVTRFPLGNRHGRHSPSRRRSRRDYRQPAAANAVSRGSQSGRSCQRGSTSSSRHWQSPVFRSAPHRLQRPRQSGRQRRTCGTASTTASRTFSCRSTNPLRWWTMGESASSSSWPASRRTISSKATGKRNVNPARHRSQVAGPSAVNSPRKRHRPSRLSTHRSPPISTSESPSAPNPRSNCPCTARKLRPPGVLSRSSLTSGEL